MILHESHAPALLVLACLGALPVSAREGSDVFCARQRQLLRPPSTRNQSFGVAIAADEPGLLVELSDGAWLPTESFRGALGRRLGDGVLLDGDLALLGEPEWRFPGIGEGRFHVARRSDGVWREVGIEEPGVGNGLGATFSASGELVAVANGPLVGFAPYAGVALYARSAERLAMVLAIVPPVPVRFFIHGRGIALLGRTAFVAVSDPYQSGLEGVAVLDLGTAAPGAVATRNAGANLDVLRGGPGAVGAPVALEADLSATPYSSAVVYAFPAAARIPLGSGRVLLGTSTGDGGPVRVGYSPGPLSTFEFLVPPLPGLAGAQAVFQGLLYGAPLRLTNAVDLTLGACACR